MKKKFEYELHVMLDIETLSTDINTSIINIGAASFNVNTGNIYNTIGLPIHPFNWNKDGRTFDGDTLMFWLKQGYSHFKDYKYLSPHEHTLKKALLDLKEFFIHQTIHGSIVNVWGNGATFDISILENAYKYYGIECPWNFREVRDLRTIVWLNPSVKENMKFEGVKHDPIDDCKHQIKYLVETLKSVNIL